MSRLKTAPQINLTSSIGPLIIKLKTELELKVVKELNGISNSLNEQVCGNPSELAKLKNRTSNIKKFLNFNKDRAERFQKVLNPLTRLVQTLRIAISALQLLPIPNNFTTVGVTNKFSDLLAKLKRFSNEVSDELLLLNLLLTGANSINTALIQAQTTIERIDDFIRQCTDQGIFSNPQEFSNLIEVQINKSNILEQYLGFTLQVRTLDTSKVAPLRQVVAIDKLGIIRYSSDPSFASTIEVLVDEVKFKIDKSNLR